MLPINKFLFQLMQKYEKSLNKSVHMYAFYEEKLNIEKLEHAVRTACLYDFIKDLPMGYETPIGSSGFDLSGGKNKDY